MLSHGRAWLVPLLYSLFLLACLTVAVYQFNIQNFPWKRIGSPAEPIDFNAPHPELIIFATILLWCPFDYWLLRWLQLPVPKHGLNKREIYSGSFKDRTTPRLIGRKIGGPLLVLVSLVAGCITSFYSLWYLLAVGYVAILTWVLCRIISMFGDIIFTDLNPSSGCLPVAYWQRCGICALVILNLLSLLLIPLWDAKWLPHISAIPLSGWILDAIGRACQGRCPAIVAATGILVVLLVIKHALKMYQQTVAWQKRYLIKTILFQRGEIPFQTAVRMAAGEGVQGQQLSVEELANDLRRHAKCCTLARHWSAIDHFYFGCLVAVALLPIGIILLVHYAIRKIMSADIINLHFGTLLIWCIPIFICGCLIQTISHRYLRINEFWKSPISILRWWKLHLENACVAMTTSIVMLMPGIFLNAYLYGVNYPWLRLGGLIVYLCLLTVSVWVIAGAVTALWHLRCFWPAWTKWFSGELGQLIFFIGSIVAILAGASIFEKIRFATPSLMIALAMAMPLVLAVTALVYAEVVTRNLGSSHQPFKK